MKVEQIKKIIPHRYPFLLIDRVLELEVLKRCVTLKNFTANEEFFSGHFPDAPVVPGVLIIEMLAQTACLLGKEIPKNEIMMIAGVESFKFIAPVIPGDQLIGTAVLKKSKLNLFFLEVSAVIRTPQKEEKKCAIGVLKCARVSLDSI